MPKEKIWGTKREKRKTVKGKKCNPKRSQRKIFRLSYQRKNFRHKRTRKKKYKKRTARKKEGMINFLKKKRQLETFSSKEMAKNSLRKTLKPTN